MRRIAFWIVPSAMAFLAIGDVVAGVALSERQVQSRRRSLGLGHSRRLGGRTARNDARRLYSSSLYALRDTKTPLRFALVRVTLTIVLGYLFALPLRAALGLDPQWGAAGLTVSAGIAGWVEFALLRRAVHRRMGRTGDPCASSRDTLGFGRACCGVALGVRLFVTVSAAARCRVLVIARLRRDLLSRARRLAGVEDAAGDRSTARAAPATSG